MDLYHCQTFTDELYTGKGHKYIYTLALLIATKEKYMPLYMKINHSKLIEEAFEIVISCFVRFNEDTKVELSSHLHHLGLGLKLIFEGDEELDIIKLSTGNEFIKSFLTFAKYC